MLKSWPILLAATCLALVASHPPATGLTPPDTTSRDVSRALPAPTTSRHYLANVGSPRAAQRLGYTVLDTGDSRAEIRALPKGTQALVWLGERCPSGTGPAFRRSVDRLAGNPRVLGYYLSDEPDVASCPRGPLRLAAEARYIRQASGHHQRSFIVLSESTSYHAFRPAVTHLSMIGLDPYPCSVAHPDCAFDKVAEKVRAAVAAGIPRGRIVPVYQAFGQEATSDHYYNLPTAAELRTLVARWAEQVPAPPMDYTYGWSHQGSADPTLVDSTALQGVLSAYFSR